MCHFLNGIDTPHFYLNITWTFWHLYAHVNQWNSSLMVGNEVVFCEVWWFSVSIDDGGRYPALGTRCWQSLDCSTFLFFRKRYTTNWWLFPIDCAKGETYYRYTPIHCVIKRTVHYFYILCSCWHQRWRVTGFCEIIGWFSVFERWKM